MSITTMIAPDTALCLDVIRKDVLNCLKRQPGVPLTIEEIKDNIAGITNLQVERALFALEGPVASIDGINSGYVHRCRCTNTSVYIP